MQFLKDLVTRQILEIVNLNEVKSVSESIYKDSKGHWRDSYENLIWLNPGSISFTKEQMKWLLPLLDDLGAGFYVPEPQGGYMDSPITSRRIRAVSGAAFTRIVELSAEINWRLARVFRDGRDPYLDRELLEKHYCEEQTIESLARLTRLEDVERRIERVLQYISGWRKTRTYQEFVCHPMKAKSPCLKATQGR